MTRAAAADDESVCNPAMPPSPNRRMASPAGGRARSPSAPEGASSAERASVSESARAVRINKKLWERCQARTVSEAAEEFRVGVSSADDHHFAHICEWRAADRFVL